MSGSRGVGLKKYGVIMFWYSVSKKGNQGHTEVESSYISENKYNTMTYRATKMIKDWIFFNQRSKQIPNKLVLYILVI